MSLNRYIFHNLLIVLLALALTSLSSCGGQGATRSKNNGQGDTLTHYSQLLTLIDYGEYITADIEDPWNPGRKLARYAFVGPRAMIGDGIDDDVTLIRVPLNNSLVYSSVHVAAIKEIGALDAIGAVADGMYYLPNDTITQMIAKGKIMDIGSAMAPNPEKIAFINPDAILLSPYENAGHGIVDALGLPAVECADYMETSPIGRAEWVKLLGVLYGCLPEANALFDKVKDNYESIVNKVATESDNRPRILTEQLTSGVWFVPGGDSYMARLLTEAGGEYPWLDRHTTGSLQLDAASVLDKAEDADIWIMRTYGPRPTLQSLAETCPIVTGIKAHQTGNVYNCNTAESPIFNDIAFRPDLVLSEFAALLHPDLFPDYQYRYYTKIEP